MGFGGLDDHRIGHGNLDFGRTPDRFHIAQLAGFDEWNSMRREMNIYLRALASERGNLESALTLIPLMILFLAVTQICLSVYSRDTYGETTQGAVAYSAMGSTQIGVGQAGQAGQAWSSAPIALPLPGGGSVLVGQRQIHNPALTPLLPGGDLFTTTGVAVQE